MCVFISELQVNNPKEPSYKKKKKSRTLLRAKPFIIDTAELLVSVTTKTLNQE